MRRILETRPSEYIARRQREYPPCGSPGYNYGVELYNVLKSRLPAKLRASFDSGLIAIGEVGILIPEALTSRVGEGFAIEVNSGLPRFFYELSRALCLRCEIRSQTGELIFNSSVSFEETSELIASVFRQFMQTDLVLPSSHSLSPEQLVLASRLATHAEAFVVAHEIGHVGFMRSLKSPEDFQDSNLSLQREELVADGTALMIILGISDEFDAEGEHFDVSIAYAGAEFAVRALASLERLGFPLSKYHPKAADRLDYIRHVTRDRSSNDDRYGQISSIAAAFDTLLGSVEAQLTNDKPFQVKETGDSFWSKLEAFLRNESEKY
jgi:hypothetical protein